jgi:drug/metabolite transporter (DMT)-like permease
VNPQFRGIICILFGVALVSLQDAMVKQFRHDYALHQIMLVRAGVAFSIALVFVKLEGGFQQHRTKNLGWLIGRGFLLVVANTCFFLGLAAVPVAQAVGILFFAPLLITALSALLLREPVGIRRWSGVFIGLLGVLVILRPGAGTLGWAGLLPLVAALAYGFMQILVRHMGKTESAGTMATYTQVTLLVSSAVVGLAIGDGSWAQHASNDSAAFAHREWTAPVQLEVVLWCTMGVLSRVGSYFATQAYRLANAPVVAPFEYVAMPFAVLWGFSLYGEIPDGVTILGIAMIVGSGLYVMHREMRRRG